MNNSAIFVPLLLASAAFSAAAQASPAPNKVGVIQIQTALLSTTEGKKAADDLQTRYEPKRQEIAEKQKELAALREQLNKGSNTMSNEAKQSLALEIDQKNRSLSRLAEDAQADFEQDRNRILQDLGQRMMVVIQKYAQDNGYSVILDISSPETPVLWASSAIDVTSDIVALYDKNSPAASKPAAAPSKPAAPPSKPPAPVKKQP